MQTEFLKDIVRVQLSDNEYVKDKSKKNQIYLHHTAGASSGVNTLRNWNVDSRGRIATCVCVANTGAKEGDGVISQGFNSYYWAYHLGVKREVFSAYDLPYVELDKHSIGVEICAWGQLTEKGGRFYNYVNKEVPNEEVCGLEEKYKGHRFFHRYSDEQIRSVENLLKYWGELYGIPLSYDHDNMWDVSTDALSGKPGIYTHNSVRRDKIDIFPQPEMIQMLKNI